MIESTQDAKLKQTLLDSERQQHLNPRAQLTCRNSLTTLVVTCVCLAILFGPISQHSNGQVSNIRAEETSIFYNTSSTWQWLPPDESPKTTATSSMTDEYYWPRRGRTLAMDSAATYTAPSDFSRGPSWSWKNELNEKVRHSPLIDQDRNIYIISTSRIRKLTSDGSLLWTFQTTPSEGTFNMCPTLHEGQVLGVIDDFSFTKFMSQILIFSIKMSDGSVNWKRHHSQPRNANADAATVVSNTLIFDGAQEANGMPNKVIGANASDGTLLWEFASGDVFWNLSPADVGDGSIIFSSTSGVVFRISVKDGKPIWIAGQRHGDLPTGVSGGALGPNGLFYAAYNKFPAYSRKIIRSLGSQFVSGYFDALDQGFNTLGYIAARQVSDGSLVWKRSLHRHVANYPAVGMLDGKLAVVVPVGDEQVGPFGADRGDWNKNYIFEKPLLWAQPSHAGYMTAAILALNARDGTMIWQSEEPKWYSPWGKGELRMKTAPRPSWPFESTCLPDPTAIPLILGDGTVYQASSHGGWLRAIRDSDHNGIIEPSEVKTFNNDFLFLNSPSAAPGMLVAAACWGDVHIFKS